MKSILLVKKLLGLVEMTSGLVNASFSLPKWQAVKVIFFALCQRHIFFFISLKNGPNVALFYEIHCDFEEALGVREADIWKKLKIEGKRSIVLGGMRTFPN